MEKHLLPHEISGNPQSKELLVFLHGWPDTCDLWNKIIPPFEQNCYILNVSYPNFSAKEKNPNGITFDEVIERLIATIEHVNSVAKRRIILVGHDWGAFYSYYLDHKHPKYVSEIIALDVAANPPFNPFMIIFLFIYQLILITAFLIGGSIGKWMTRGFLKCLFYKPPWVNRIDSSWNYPYYMLWKYTLKTRKGPIEGYEPSCPVVYVAGTKKPFVLHSRKWLDMLAKNPKSEYHLLDFVHWIQIEKPDFLIDLIHRRLKSS